MSIELSMKLLNSDKYYDNLVWEDDLVIDFSCFFSLYKTVITFTKLPGVSFYVKSLYLNFLLFSSCFCWLN